MTSQRPYLLQAILDWVLDNGLTPYVVVETTVSGVKVPQGYIENHRIVLNVSPNAVRYFRMGEGWLRFDSRFSGSVYHVAVPVGAVIAIYAKETGQGMVFDVELPDDSPHGPEATEKSSHEKSNRLQLVK